MFGIADQARPAAEPEDSDARFEQLMRAHEQPVLRTSMRLLGNLQDAQDAAQEVFLRLYRNRHKFAGDAEMRPWLYRVTVNVCRDLARKRRWTVVELDEKDMAVDELREERITADERRALVAEALSLLPPQEREAIVLREIEDLETAEVAEILGSTPGTVRSQISKGRARLQAIVARLERRKR